MQLLSQQFILEEENAPLLYNVMVHARSGCLQSISEQLSQLLFGWWAVSVLCSVSASCQHLILALEASVFSLDDLHWLLQPCALVPHTDSSWWMCSHWSVIVILSTNQRSLVTLVAVVLHRGSKRQRCCLLSQWRVRREAMMGLALIYKKYCLHGEVGKESTTQIDWIKDKLLHIYYQNSIDDKWAWSRIILLCVCVLQGI